MYDALGTKLSWNLIIRTPRPCFNESCCYRTRLENAAVNIHVHVCNN